MLDVTDLVCPALRTPFLESLMTIFGYYGHGAVGVVIGLALLGHGHLLHNDRNRTAGIAALFVLALASAIVEVLKYTLQPQPDLRSYLSPSGRTSTAVGLASVLSVSFPALSPVFFGLAILTAVCRLYWRSPNTWNVVSGAVIGLAVGLPIAKQFIPHGNTFRPNWLWLGAWAGVLLVGLSSLAFVYHTENRIAVHRMADNNISDRGPVIATLDFGAPQARPSLRYGWSGDESWNEGRRSVVWAIGLGSELIMSLPAAQAYRFRFNSFPYSPKGPACQRIEVRVNGQFVAKVSLAKGWHGYQIDVPQKAIHPGGNFVQFFYDYAESPASHSRGSDDRRLSVAFDSLQVLTKN